MTTPNLITLTEPRSPAAEAFRTLRTNLTFSSADKPLHTLLVTSAANADGKSSAAANLAVTLAQAGNKTILVDADLRQPSQHTLWGIDNGRGLSTMMTDDALLANPPLIATSVEHLLLLPTGALPPIPADVLGSPRMNEIIGILKVRAHYIIFDCPPVLAASDAALLGAKTDGTLLVVRAGHTRRDHVERAKNTLERVRVRILGAVLTNAPRESAGHY
ncbi:MAG: CpsD/CapB family tyrosine-protein kinase [Armatimonadetes bacterium]|nr:CpsD/CapB family tyrosine-protein kinase [Anaerolineae bacterium]